MECLRKFKSFQPEKQEARDKAEAEARKKSGFKSSRWDAKTKKWIDTTNSTSNVTPFIADRRELKKLFPGLLISELEEWAYCDTKINMSAHTNLKSGKDYRVFSRVGNQITVYNEDGEKRTVPDCWFKPTYKKYDFEVWAGIITKSAGVSIGKAYQLLGETPNGYEIVNDKGMRFNYSKKLFTFPRKTKKR